MIVCIYNNGITNIDGTTINGATTVNGLLKAANANFSSLNINGNVNLTKCIINGAANIRGSLTAVLTEFEGKLKIYSNNTHFVSSKVNGNLQFGHTIFKKQVVYLDNSSEIIG